MPLTEIIAVDYEKERQKKWDKRSAEIRAQREEYLKTSQANRLAYLEKKQVDYDNRKKAVARDERIADAKSYLGSFVKWGKPSSQGGVPIARISRHPDSIAQANRTVSHVERSTDFWSNGLGSSGGPFDTNVGSSFNWGLQSPRRNTVRHKRSTWKKGRR